MNESRSTAIITLTVMMLTGKKQRSTVLNARRTKFYEFRVQLHGISRARCSFLLNTPGNFSTRHIQCKQLQ